MRRRGHAPAGVSLQTHSVAAKRDLFFPRYLISRAVSSLHPHGRPEMGVALPEAIAKSPLTIFTGRPRLE